MKLDKFTGPGSTATRRAFWDNVADVLMSMTKLPGKNVSVTEDPTGSLISINTQREKSQGGGRTTGACCSSENVCSTGVTREDCEGAGGTYLGDGSLCTDVDCTCCPTLTRFTAITFSGQILGCDGGTVSLPEKTWTKVAGGFGCSLSDGEWSIGPNCLCQFQARNCFPFTEVDQLFIDDVGDCSGLCKLSAEFFCNDGTVLLAGSTTTDCCPGGSNAEDLDFHGPYDITSGSLDVTYPSDTNPAISFRYVITLS